MIQAHNGSRETDRPTESGNEKCATGRIDFGPLCRPNLTERRNTMILILILSDATNIFEIRLVAMIHY